MSKPITDEELAKMKASAEMVKGTWYAQELLHCISEIERLKEDISTLRQLREFDAKERISPLTDTLP